MPELTALQRCELARIVDRKGQPRRLTIGEDGTVLIELRTFDDATGRASGQAFAMGPVLLMDRQGRCKPAHQVAAAPPPPPDPPPVERRPWWDRGR